MHSLTDSTSHPHKTHLHRQAVFVQLCSYGEKMLRERESHTPQGSLCVTKFSDHVAAKSQVGFFISHKEGHTGESKTNISKVFSKFKK